MFFSVGGVILDFDKYIYLGKRVLYGGGGGFFIKGVYYNLGKIKKKGKGVQPPHPPEKN